jgi:hypothetical protein
MGCAKDIVEHVGVPRFLFSDFPLGNAAGRPNDAASQALTRSRANRARASAGTAHHGAITAPVERKSDWKLDYCNIEQMSPEEIRRRRAEFDAGKAEAKRIRENAATADPSAPRP